MTKDDYLVWRHQQVTEEFLENVLSEMDAQITALVDFAGENPQRDFFRRGVLQGLKFLADWQPRFFDEEGDTDDAESVGTQDTY